MCLHTFITHRFQIQTEIWEKKDWPPYKHAFAWYVSIYSRFKGRLRFFIHFTNWSICFLAPMRTRTHGMRLAGKQACSHVVDIVNMVILQMNVSQWFHPGRFENSRPFHRLVDCSWLFDYPFDSHIRFSLCALQWQAAAACWIPDPHEKDHMINCHLNWI